MAGLRSRNKRGLVRDPSAGNWAESPQSRSGYPQLFYQAILDPSRLRVLVYLPCVTAVIVSSAFSQFLEEKLSNPLCVLSSRSDTGVLLVPFPLSRSFAAVGYED